MSANNKAEVTDFLTPGVAASRLGVSGAALRRMASAFEEVHGPLPEVGEGRGRLWPSQAVERLREARALMTAGGAKSVEGALRALEGGAAHVSVEASPELGRDSRVLEVIAARLEAVERLELEVTELRREVGELRALPSPEGMSERADERTQDGVLVQIARRLERLLRR